MEALVFRALPAPGGICSSSEPSRPCYTIKAAAVVPAQTRSGQLCMVHRSWPNSSSTGLSNRLRQQARAWTTLFAFVLGSRSATALRHTSTWLGGGTSCAGSSIEATLCQRDNWINAQPASKGGGPDPLSIPEVIHFAWFPATKPLPAKYAEWQQTWANTHSGWQVWLWSDVSNRLLVSRYNQLSDGSLSSLLQHVPLLLRCSSSVSCRHYSWLLKFYDSLPSEIMRCDFVRPMYMHR